MSGRPPGTLLICSCVCSGQQQFLEKPRGPKLLDAVMATLRNDGSILMPIDTAGRVLEIMLVLEKHWAMNRLSYPLALLTPVAYNTLEFAKSQLEWMNEQVAKEFESSRDKDNPFSMRCDLQALCSGQCFWTVSVGCFYYSVSHVDP